MSVTDVIDAFIAHLAPTIAPATIGPATPTAPADLAAVTLSLDDVEPSLVAIGGRPAPSRTGALAVSQDIDLADPTLTFPDGEQVELLSADRRRLHVAFGPVVAAGGDHVATLGAGDLTVEVDGTPVAVVAGTPAAGQVQGDPALGELVFGAPLPLVGDLRADYFVGEWEVSTERYRGRLVVDVAADGIAPTIGLSDAVVGAFHAANATNLAGLHRLQPIHVGPVTPLPGVDNGRTRTLSYAFDFEVEHVTLGTGGGVIGTVEFDAFVDNPAAAHEEFEVPA